MGGFGVDGGVKWWLTRENNIVTSFLTVLPPVRLKQREVALGFCLWLRDWFG